MIETIIALAGLIVGCLIGYLIFRYVLTAKFREMQNEAQKEAEVIKQKKMLEVKEKFLNKKAELEKEVQQRNQQIQQHENRLKQREISLNQRQDEISRKKSEIENERKRLENIQQALEKREEELKDMENQERVKLEAISGLSADEARDRLIESLKDEAKTNAASYINEIMDDAKMTANKEAKRIVIQSIQRVATETAIENSVTIFHIDNDEVKGRIIGREGRNIRALEAATGVEIVVDDTPEAIVISAFDPVRREICRLALHQLVTDGRIHPARIEEVVSKVTKQVEEEIIETGKRTAIDLGIHGLHPELIRIIGKMKYRSSYGQNLLQHARETANLCAVMASELGLNPKKAKRAGLLHDIGKVPDEEPELPHAIYGAKLAEKYKEKPEICNAIGAHHDEMEMMTLLAPIVQVCDAISGARPGARREIVEAYIKRLNDLENIAMSYPGVTKTYAIQAGRELRVIVGADKISDKETEELSNFCIGSGIRGGHLKCFLKVAAKLDVLSYPANSAIRKIGRSVPARSRAALRRRKWRMRSDGVVSWSFRILRRRVETDMFSFEAIFFSDQSSAGAAPISLRRVSMCSCPSDSTVRWNRRRISR